MSKDCESIGKKIGSRGKRKTAAETENSESKLTERNTEIEQAMDSVIDEHGNTVWTVYYAALDGQIGLSRYLSGHFMNKIAVDNSGNKQLIFAYNGTVWVRDENESYLDGTEFAIAAFKAGLDALPVAESREDPVNKYRAPLVSALNYLKQCNASKTICLRALTGKNGCIVPSKAWDNDSGRLNTPSGMVVLATGERQETKPEDYMRRQTNIEYLLPEELAKYPELWIQTLKEIFFPLGLPEDPEYEDTDHLMADITHEEENLDTAKYSFGDREDARLCAACRKYEEAVARNAEKKRAYEEQMEAWRNGDILEEMIEFIQRFCGYILLGTNPEHKFAILIGDKGRNGKGVLAHTLLNILGDYGAEARSELFLKTRTPAAGAATPELVSLAGKRLVVGSETDRGDAINSTFLKRVTGGDKMSGRDLYRGETQMKLRFVPWIPTNFFPHFDSEDNALIKRCVVIPFNRTFEYDPKEITPLVGKRDDSLEDRLREEYEAIFAWCIEGARKYLQDGLKMPAIIAEAAETYRKNKDVIGCFLKEDCEAGDRLEVLSSELYGAYAQWCQEGHITPSNRQVFRDRLTARGFRYVKNSSVFVKGVSLNEAGLEMLNAYEYRNGHHRG